MVDERTYVDFTYIHTLHIRQPRTHIHTLGGQRWRANSTEGPVELTRGRAQWTWKPDTVDLGPGSVDFWPGHLARGRHPLT